MPMGAGPMAGPGFKPSGPNPYERPKVVEDPRQKEFGDVFSIAKEKLKDRIQHSQSKVDEYVTNYRQSNSDLTKQNAPQP